MTKPQTQLHLGNCLDVLKNFPDSSIDSIVTDPPYGLAFMSKRWDYDVPSVDIWAECLRVLKPGGHLLAFAGTRTQHRMAVRIEDAGFEIRDMIAWVYGCLDEQTQLVTPDGPRPYHSAKAGDPVLCYNVETKEYNYQPIQDVVVYDYSDTAYRLVGDHGEQVVSRNHRCLVERSGSEVFQLAETLEQQARVPVLEDLPALQQALRDARQSTSGQEQDLQQGVRGGDYRQGQQRPHANREAQAQPGELRGLRRRSAQSRFMAEARRHAGLQPAMQRQAPWRGMEAARQQGAKQLAAGVGAGFGQANGRRHQSGMEGRVDLPQPQGSLCRSGDPVRALPCGAAEHGAEGWLRDGAPATRGSGDWPTARQGGSRASRQPRRNGQPAGEPDAVCDERAAQGIRAWSGHRTSVVRVEPFHYTGKVWCLKVPTGCFVAWRNGMAFPTGNSGFPKSLDVSKAIDRAAGAERVMRVNERWADRYPNGPGGNLNAGGDGQQYGQLKRVSGNPLLTSDPATPEAQQWAGWGTALKPALEPITMARKPLDSTVAANVLQWGTGALNVDGCRVGREERYNAPAGNKAGGNSLNMSAVEMPQDAVGRMTSGRWPANLILTYPEDEYKLRDNITSQQLAKLAEWMNENSYREGPMRIEEATFKAMPPELQALFVKLPNPGSDEVTQLFPQTAPSKAGNRGAGKGETGRYGVYGGDPGWRGHDDAGGSAARFFYCAKASKKDRNDGIRPLELISVKIVDESTWSEIHSAVLRVSIEDSIPRVVSGTDSEADKEWSKLLFGDGTSEPLPMGCKFFTKEVSSLTPLLETLSRSIRDKSPDFPSFYPKVVGPVGRWRLGFTSTRDVNIPGMGMVSSNTRFIISDAGTIEGNNHPTVKPTDLMRYLCRLVTPPGGTVLDPFMGSGSTGKAALLEGFNFIGIEMDESYLEIAKLRIDPQD